MNQTKKQYVGGALISYISIAVGVLSGLFYTPWMIESIGDDQYALYALAMSVINIFLLDFGIGGAVSKFLSGYYAKGQADEANAFLGIVYRVFLGIAAVVFVCLGVIYFLIDAIYVKMTPEELVVFKRLYLIVAVYSVFSLPFVPFNGILTANERFIELKICNLGHTLLNVALIVLCLINGGDVYTLVLVHAATNVVTLAVKYVIIRARTKAKANMLAKSNGKLSQLFGFSAWMTVISIAQRCIFNIMPTLIAAIVGTTEVTLFSLAATLESYVYTFTQAINGMFMPRIARIYEGNDQTARLQQLMGKVGRFHIYTLGLLYVGFLCVGRLFVEAWMGQGYEIVYVCACLLIFPSLIDTPQQVAKTALIVTNVMREQAMIFVGMAVINVGLSVILMRFMGIVGAALSVLVAYLFRTCMFNVLYRRKLRVSIGAYFKGLYPRWILVAGITAVVGWFGIAKIPMRGWLGVLVQAACMSLVYGVLTLLVGLNGSERKQAIQLARKLIRRGRA